MPSQTRQSRLVRTIVAHHSLSYPVASQLWRHAAARRRQASGYAAAVGGVALASLAIALVQAHVHIENISLLYLLVVLWLATVFGRGPAIAASVLAFLTFDFFFIPPLFRLTVDNPAEWVSLFALLATALVLGQLTAANQARTREALASQREAVARRQQAIASEQRTTALYALSQLIASIPARRQLWQALAEHLRDVFRPSGVLATAVILPDGWNRPIVDAVAADPADASPALLAAIALETADHAGNAWSALQQGTICGGAVQATVEGPQLVYFLPLHAGSNCVGILAIGGEAAPLRRLVAEFVRARGLPPTAADRHAADRHAAGEGQGGLLAAMCDAIALAIDRDALRATAVHAEALQESDRLKNALLGSVTHDLRTPLASIQAAADSLLEPEMIWSDEERAEFSRTIATSARRLTRLVNNLLDLSRLEAGVAVPRKEWHDLEDLLATVLDRLDLAGRLAGRRVIVEAPDDLPLVPVDHEQIEQVFTNLLENALKYSPESAPVRVRIGLREGPRRVEVAVVDEGIGIPAIELTRIFDKFYRVQHATLPWMSNRPPLGTGLGLAICKGIIEAHSGRIWAESEPGQGTRLIFTLPLPDAPPDGGLPDLPASTGDVPADREDAR